MYSACAGGALVFITVLLQPRHGPGPRRRLLEWTDKKETGLVSKKVASIVILKNLFEPSEFDDDPMGITEISDDVRAECSKCGPVSKVIVYDVCHITRCPCETFCAALTSC
jgi:hypothetical protein